MISVNVSAVNTKTKEELELSSFLLEFKDVFTDDIPRELPPV